MNLIKKIKRNHFLYSTFLLLSVLPVKALVVPVLLLLIVSWIVAGSFTDKLSNLKANYMSVVFMLPYVSYLLGMLYTENLEFGLKDIELKLSLIIFPLIFGSTKFPLYRYKNFLASVFVYSSTFYGLTSILYGMFKFQQVPTYGMMDLFLHPSYLAMYLNTAIVLTIFLIHQPHTKGIHQVFLKICLVLLSLSIWLCLSKSGLLVWCLLIFGWMSYGLLVKKYFKTLILIFLLCALGFSSAVLFIESVEERFHYLKEISFEVDEVNKSTAESSQVRILVWDKAIDLIVENPLFGTGTGDIKDELFRKYEAAGMTGALENKLNVHNQYLQIFATLGILGFITFLLSLLLPTVKATQKKNRVYLAFLFVFGLNLMFESMLEKQDGVVFYAFLNALFYFHFSPKSSEES